MNAEGRGLRTIQMSGSVGLICVLRVYLRLTLCGDE